MTKFVCGIFFHAADALLIEELHVVASIAIEEIVGTYTEPEQIDLPVSVIGLVIDVGQVGRSKRTVAAEIRELIEIKQSVGKCLIAATGETADGTVIGIVDGAVVLLYIGHQVGGEVETEHVLAKTGYGDLR